jgi:uncharacterized repeat protein (TIGR01451 family)
MPSFGDLTRRTYWLAGSLLRSSKFRAWRFLATALSAFLISIFLPQWGHQFGQPIGSPAYAQVTTITNQAGGRFTSGGAPVNVTSNQTTASLGAATNAVAPFTIVKTADRGAAEPGDIVTYRLLITNNTATAITPLVVADQMPLGVNLIPDSFRYSPVNPTTTNISGRSFSLQFATLAANQSITVVYAAQVTPDAVRGSGRNTASANGANATAASTFQLAIRPGIVADCGTIVGRVFVDKNFDGHQQDGEPGVPDAVIYLDSGNRILTDPDGLFSLINVLSGPHVGTIDLSSLPGYTLAPNLYWLADNSVSRLVRLEPGGLARMNFAVTPTFGEGQSE